MTTTTEELDDMAKAKGKGEQLVRYTLWITTEQKANLERMRDVGWNVSKVVRDAIDNAVKAKGAKHGK